MKKRLGIWGKIILGIATIISSFIVYFNWAIVERYFAVPAFMFIAFTGVKDIIDGIKKYLDEETKQFKRF